MEIIEYTENYFEEIYNVVHNTIETIYPKYYPRKAVDFFHTHHSKENMLEKLPNEYTRIIIENKIVSGIGSVKIMILEGFLFYLIIKIKIMEKYY